MQVDREDILSRFLQVTGTDPIYLRDIILNFIIAGKDTTATTLAWFIYLLCKHPSVQEKIVQEVKQVTGMKKITNFSKFASGVSEDALEKMHYLHAAITETLRIYPAVPVVRKIIKNFSSSRPIGKEYKNQGTNYIKPCVVFVLLYFLAAMNFYFSVISWKSFFNFPTFQTSILLLCRMQRYAFLMILCQMGTV